MMKLMIIGLIVCSVFTTATAQETPVKTEKQDTAAKPVEFVELDVEPSFPGGLRSFYKYVSETVRYPKKAINDNVQGQVLLSFIVEKDGRLVDIKVVQGVSPEIDKEAIRVIRASPKWRPGVLKDKVVRVVYKLPINFNL